MCVCVCGRGGLGEGEKSRARPPRARAAASVRHEVTERAGGNGCRLCGAARRRRGCETAARDGANGRAPEETGARLRACGFSLLVFVCLLLETEGKLLVRAAKRGVVLRTVIFNA